MSDKQRYSKIQYDIFLLQNMAAQLELLIRQSNDKDLNDIYLDAMKKLGEASGCLKAAQKPFALPQAIAEAIPA